MIDVGILIGVGGLLLSVLSFFIGQQTKARSEGKTDGAKLATMQADIKYIREKLAELSGTIDKRELRRSESTERLHSKIEAVSQRITEEMMDHIEKYHSGG